MAVRRDFGNESRLAKVRRGRRIVRTLAETYPDVRCELDFENPFQLLVAAVLSAQTTDRRVNAITPTLFAKYPRPVDLAAADREELEELLRPIGFYRAKAARIVALAGDLQEKFHGEVPARMEDLVSITGVGRKTANVVLGEGFGIPGITVDTHVTRLSRRMGLTTSADPVVIEQDLAGVFPRAEWTSMSQLLIWHGRRRCHARRPACGACPVSRWCPSFGEGPTDAAEAEKLVRTEGPA